MFLKIFKNLCFGFFCLLLFFTLFCDTASAQITADFEILQGYSSGSIDNQLNWHAYFGDKTAWQVVGDNQYSGLYSLNFATSSSNTAGLRTFFATSSTMVQCLYANVPTLTSGKVIFIILDHSNNYNYPNAIFRISDTNWIYGLSLTNTYNAIAQGSGWTKLCFHLRDSRYITYQVNNIFTPEYTVNNVVGNPPDSLTLNYTGAGTINAYLDFFTSATTSIPLGLDVVEMPDWSANVYIGGDDYLVPFGYTKCTIGTSCQLWFNYGYQAIGGAVGLFNASTPNWDLVNAIGIKGLYSQNLLDEYFSITDPAVPQVQEYKMLWVNSDLTDFKTYENITVEWVAENFDELTIDFDTICDDIATSTLEFWDLSSYAGAFRYAIECGFRKITYYFLVPSDTSRDYFKSSASRMKNQFPYNTFFSLSDAVYTAISTSTNMNGSLGIPFIEKDTGEFFIMPVLASSSISNAIGTENANNFRLGLTWIMWITTAGAIIGLVYISFF